MILHLLSFLRTIVLMSVWFSSLFLQMQELARYRDQSNPLSWATSSTGRTRSDLGHAEEK
jgi:hypothetical protein